MTRQQNNRKSTLKLLDLEGITFVLSSRDWQKNCVNARSARPDIFLAYWHFLHCECARSRRRQTGCVLDNPWASVRQFLDLFMTSFVLLCIFLLFIALLRYTVINLRGNREKYPRSASYSLLPNSSS